MSYVLTCCVRHGMWSHNPTWWTSWCHSDTDLILPNLFLLCFYAAHSLLASYYSKYSWNKWHCCFIDLLCYFLGFEHCLLGGPCVFSQCILGFPLSVLKERGSTAYIQDILKKKWELGGSGGNEMRFIWIRQQCNSHHGHLTFTTWRSESGSAIADSGGAVHTLVCCAWCSFPDLVA